MQQRRIAFIGAGNMTAAIISGLVNSGYPSNLITASNPSPQKLDKLAERHGINTTQDNHHAVAESDVIVLAVKPQLMEQVCQDLAKQSLAGKVFVSIAAGINSERLLDMLGGHYPLIRTMPNTPSLLSKGMTGLFAQDSVDESDKTFVFDMMSSVGEAIWVKKESDIDIVIATAGSSPAYFFLFLEAMQNHAMALGMDKNTSRKLVQQAMLGAAEMVCHNEDLELSELRAQVTSKGGTTAKAIESFQSDQLTDLVAKAMDAAIKRAQQMTQQF
ncbi:pyrroline-5-carboxylate reductase [Aliiglaciecola litoralis]|uniref:Pyrroline-5-carboxylate reductase n=1 Tax=Aliiglaciecola litoralis TaxID=582857 RepID=A0ABP3WT32_9ALTE